MPNDKLEKLKNLISLLQHDTVTPQEIEKFLTIVVNTIKQTNDSFKSLSQENLQQIRQAIAYIENKHTEVLDDVDVKADQLKASVNAKIAEIRGLIEEVGSIEYTDGKDGADGKDADEAKIIEEVLKKIPAAKDVVLDNGEVIVDKINALSLEDNNKIDAVHIKNLPKQTQIPSVGGVRYFENLADVSIPITKKRANLIAQYNTTNNRWENGIAITVSATAPTSPQTNDLWVDIS